MGGVLLRWSTSMGAGMEWHHTRMRIVAYGNEINMQSLPCLFYVILRCILSG
jgi:hypothetical protein